jgi:murein DD-endopeptidase MepM/ murein hydrolase activator NlpD
MGNSRYIVASILVLLTVQLCLIPAANAQSARQQRDRLNRQIQQKHQRIKELSHKKVELQAEIKKFDTKIEDKEAEVRSIKKQLSLTQSGLDKALQEKQEIESNLSGYRDALGSRMRSVYMNSDLTYLDLLFSAGDFNDFVDRIFYVQTICARDEELIDKTQEDQALLAEKITQINTKLAEIERYKVAQQVQLGELNTLKRAKNENLNTIESEKALAERQAKEMEAQSAAIAQLIRRGSSSAGAYRGQPWSGSFKRPCGGPIMSGFGTRVHPISRVRKMHTGVDIGAGYGAAVHAAGNGKVTRTGWFGGYGNCVIIDHGGKPNRSTLYGHLSAITCVAGQEVKVGTVVGKVGSTGYSTGPHLHFEVRINGNPVNPMTN